MLIAFESLRQHGHTRVSIEVPEPWKVDNPDSGVSGKHNSCPKNLEFTAVLILVLDRELGSGALQ